MYIGRIITKGKNLETLDFVEVTTKFEKGDNSIPTLIIGKENAEKIYGKENIHVLDKKIEDNVYWTFGKLERRNDFERDLQSFNKLLLDNLLRGVKYEYFNVFTCGYNDTKLLLHKIDTLKNNIFYVTDRHLYMLLNKTVVGVSFDELEYVGISRDKVIERIKSNKNNKIINNDYFISKNMRKYFNNNRIIIPYVYFLSKN